MCCNLPCAINWKHKTVVNLVEMKDVGTKLILSHRQGICYYSRRISTGIGYLLIILHFYSGTPGRYPNGPLTV